MQAQDLAISKLAFGVRPLGLNEIQVQIMNLADRFDDKKELGLTQFVAMAQNVKDSETTKSQYDVQFVDLMGFAESLFYMSPYSSDPPAKVEPEVQDYYFAQKLPKITIEETLVDSLPILKRVSWREQRSPGKMMANYPVFLNPTDKAGYTGVALQP